MASKGSNPQDFGDLEKQFLHSHSLVGAGLRPGRVKKLIRLHWVILLEFTKPFARANRAFFRIESQSANFPDRLRAAAARTHRVVERMLFWPWATTTGSR